MTEMEGVERVIEHPLNFKSKLGIGEDVFEILRTKKLVGEGVRILDTAHAFGAGAALASSSIVATAFFAPTGFLAALGIGAAAVTPIGWVIAAGGASAAAYYGITEYLRSGREDRVIVIPIWINTPLDALAFVLFNFFAPLGLRVAAIDGEIYESERQCIESYFVSEWGYSPEFVRKALPETERNLENLRVVELVNNMIEYKISSPDCNYEAMAKELTDFLREVTRANGELHDLEVIFIQWLEIALARGRRGFWDKLNSAARFNRRLPVELNGDSSQGRDDGNGSSQEEPASDSTLAGRNFRSALRWANDQL